MTNEAERAEGGADEGGADKDELAAVRVELEAAEAAERASADDASAAAIADAARAGRRARPRAPRGWKPGARGTRDLAGPDGAPIFSADELAAMDAPVEGLSPEARRARKRLLNRYSEARIRADERKRVEAADRDREAVARAIEGAPEEPVTGREFFEAWNAGIEVADLFRLIPIMEEPISTRWTDAECASVAPLVLRLYQKYPALLAAARAAGGAELRMALLVAPAVAAKAAAIYALARARIAGVSFADLREGLAPAKDAKT